MLFADEDQKGNAMRCKRLILTAVFIGSIAVIVWLALFPSPKTAGVTVSAIGATNDSKGNRQMVFLITNNQPRAVRYWATEQIKAKITGEWTTVSRPFNTGDVAGKSSDHFKRSIPSGVDAWSFKLGYATVPNFLDMQIYKLCGFLHAENWWQKRHTSLLIESGPS